jgi:3-hydroxy-9,10-secoandrosta-1,3,5(10)-triene-9,17-dione monooxygenase
VTTGMTDAQRPDTARRHAGRAAGPDLTATPEELVQRAAGMRDLLREQQDEAEARGYYSEQVHQAFLDAGFYHILTPKRYGGYEYDITTFFRVITEVARGDPGTGWCLCLGHGHNLTTASYFSEAAQDQVFNNPMGYFRASHSAVPAGTATPVEGGYVINATSPYQSGAPYSSHVTVNLQYGAEQEQAEGEGQGEGRPRMATALVPAGQFTMLHDWGGEATFGLRSSGSNTVVVDDQFLPEELVVPMDWLFRDHNQGTIGTELHNNPMYMGRIGGFFHGELVAPILGAARAALDEYADIVTSRRTSLPPFRMRYEDQNYQRDFGMALTMVDAAEAIIMGAADMYTAQGREWFETGKPITREEDQRPSGMMQRAGQMASEAVELLFRSAGSSASKRGQRMQRYFRDVMTYRGHGTAQFLNWAPRYAMTYFGLNAPMSSPLQS